jgi:hypothetical protein
LEWAASSVSFFADYIDSLKTGREPHIPFADCVRVTEIALRARQSARTGKPYTL